MLPNFFQHARETLPIGSICIYPGPVKYGGGAVNSAWNGCASNAWQGAPARDADNDAGDDPVDSPPALLEVLGWLVCDGRPLRKGAFPQLWAVLGTLYGGDEDNFCLPDLRGVFLRGVDAGAGVDPDVGQRRAPNGDAGYGGVGSLQCDALQTHEHDYAQQSLGQGGSPVLVPGSTPPVVPSSAPVNARISSETRPRNVAVWFIIRAR